MRATNLPVLGLGKWFLGALLINEISGQTVMEAQLSISEETPITVQQIWGLAFMAQRGTTYTKKCMVNQFMRKFY